MTNSETLAHMKVRTPVSKSPEKAPEGSFTLMSETVFNISMRRLRVSLTPASVAASMSSSNLKSTISRVTCPLCTAVRMVVAGVVGVMSKLAPGSLRFTNVRIVSKATREKTRMNLGLMIFERVSTPEPRATIAAFDTTTSTVGHFPSVSYVHESKCPAQWGQIDTALAIVKPEKRRSQKTRPMTDPK